MKRYVLDNSIWQKLFSLGTACQYKPGELLYMQGEATTGLFCIKQGRIKNCTYFAKGVEKTLCILEAPAITGETAVVDDGISISSAVAMTNVEAVIIPRNVAHEFLLGHPEVMMLFLEVFAEKIRCMHFQAESTVLTVTQRLATLLLNSNQYGIICQSSKEGKLYITHDQLAGILGTTRPKVTDSLNRFTEMGLIEKKRGYIDILDQDGLMEIMK